MRKCSKCGKVLHESKFNWKIKGVKLSSHCKSCSRMYVQRHYKNNKNYYLVKARKRNRALRQASYLFLGEYLLTHPCIDCGEKNVLVLEFDHKSRKDKSFEINKILRKRLSLDRLQSEVSKCEVRCANCHRRKTEKENKSWRLKYAPVA